ncbi:type II toxin-antitoxin system HicB family antitoxin [Patescibacteria group bacterium]|nr:MAG: type II toxin-antitoxin system HicB family antitoxin [Patescibacteria group bacterium]
MYDFSVMFQPAEEGGYDVFVPALPGCVTQGDSLEEAKRMAEDAIRLYCESLIASGEPIPQRSGEFVGHVRIAAEPA